jgi:hypothetical protein
MLSTLQGVVCSIEWQLKRGLAMYEVCIFSDEAPALITDSKEEALTFWKENRRNPRGQVGVFDRAAHERKEYPWIA